MDWSAIATMSGVAVFVGAGLIGQAKLYGKRNQEINECTKAIRGEDGLSHKIEAANTSLAQLKQKVDDMDNTLHNGIIDKVDTMGQEFAELRGSVTTFMEMKRRGEK